MTLTSSRQIMILAIREGKGAQLYWKFGGEDTDGFDMAYRVIADHIRTLTMAITNGGKLDSYHWKKVRG